MTVLVGEKYSRNASENDEKGYFFEIAFFYLIYRLQKAGVIMVSSVNISSLPSSIIRESTQV